jgi:hypothetical protein
MKLREQEMDQIPPLSEPTTSHPATRADGLPIKEWLNEAKLRDPEQPQSSPAPPTRSPSAREKAEVSTIESYAKEVDRFIDANPKSLRIYANVASGIEKAQDEWHEFKNEKEREGADNGDNLNENAYVWLRRGKVVIVRFTFQSPSRDWAHFITYYFREDGSLAKIEAQLNTFFGDMSVNRESWYSPEGNVLRSTLRYLDLKTKKRKKPGTDFQDEPVPLYRRVENLPFLRQ